MEDVRRAVPRTDTILADPRLVRAAERLGLSLVKEAVKAAQQRVRDGGISPGEAADCALTALPAFASSLRPVLNATGVIVHTNLGRAPLPTSAVEALVMAAGTTDVEIDLVSGRRGRRGRGTLAALAAAVPAAEAVHVVNNNAAALALVSAALASGRELIVSRGELVEIGDGFRIPDLLTSTGARLREVGTTNRTTVSDYAAAIGPDTAILLKVHPSNFVVSGFTADVAVGELAGLAREHRVPLVVDIGSGLLAPHPLLPSEPDAGTTLGEGADLVTASGDKLLGGPQAGLILGRADLVERLRRHPLARALRVDKLTLAALEATLRGTEPPVHRMLLAAPDEIRARADRLVTQLAAEGVPAELASCVSTVGGGGAPGVELPSTAISLPESYSAVLRRADPAVLGRVERARLLLDLRTVAADSDGLLADRVRQAHRALGNS